MSKNLTIVEDKKNQSNINGALFLDTGLAVASMILVPAVAMWLALGPSLTGVLRIALMKASIKMVNGWPATTQ
jgi:hypothetical protein